MNKTQLPENLFVDTTHLQQEVNGTRDKYMYNNASRDVCVGGKSVSFTEREKEKCYRKRGEGRNTHRKNNRQKEESNCKEKKIRNERVRERYKDKKKK